MELIRLDGTNTELAAKRAADILKKGGIVAYPTDTIYGLAVSAYDEHAIAALKELKGREKKKPISVIVENGGHIEDVGMLTPLARKLALTRLPGALTLVVPAAPTIPVSLTLNGAIGVRVPDDAFCLALAKAFGRAYTSTSANRAGLPTPATADDLMRHFGPLVAKIALIVDGGERAGRKPSTVVSCLTDTPYILREGALSREELGL